ncbi:MAG: hypothetical protein K6D96_09230 [Acetatifactor sp.]|nr:hypothetical protein [Acetatifactor sp.]
MKQIASQGVKPMKEAPTYMCSTTEFEQGTDFEDGTKLMVVNESSHTVVGYYMAFNGYWNEM